jgi:hypothetical protein
LSDKKSNNTLADCIQSLFKKLASANRALVARIAEITRRSTEVNEAITTATDNRNKLKVASSLIPSCYSFLREASTG